MEHRPVELQVVPKQNMSYQADISWILCFLLFVLISLFCRLCGEDVGSGEGRGPGSSSNFEEDGGGGGSGYGSFIL